MSYSATVPNFWSPVASVPIGCVQWYKPPDRIQEGLNVDGFLLFNGDASGGAIVQAESYEDSALGAVGSYFSGNVVLFYCKSAALSPSPPAAPPNRPPHRPNHQVTQAEDVPCAAVAEIEHRVDVRTLGQVANCGDLMQRSWYTRALCRNFYKSKTNGEYTLCRLGTSSASEPDCVGWDVVKCE